MSAYLIVETHITDPDTYEVYKRMAAAAIDRHGGRYLVRGGALERLEGEWDPPRLVVIEFSSMAAAKAFFECDEYVEARKVRENAASLNILLAEGFTG